VIIVDGFSAVPDVRSRQLRTAHHGCHKTIIHEFFRSVSLRMKRRQVSPAKKQQKEQNFLADDQISVLPCQPENAFALLQAIPEYYDIQQDTAYRDADAGSRREGKDPRADQHPEKEARQRHPQYFGKQPSAVSEIL